MTPDDDMNPSVSIVAGRIEKVIPSAVIDGYMLKMRGGSTYITIRPHIARQWIHALEPIAATEEETA